MKTPLVAKLNLPFQFKLDNNFNVSLLRPASMGFPSQQNVIPPPLEISDSGHGVHEVEAILDSRIRRKKAQYVVRWSDDKDTTWEPHEHLDGCPDLLHTSISLIQMHHACRSSRLKMKGGGNVRILEKCLRKASWVSYLVPLSFLLSEDSCEVFNSETGILQLCFLSLGIVTYF